MIINKNPLLEIKNVNKAFKKNKVLKDLSLTIFENETIALVGLNGAGKSTLIEIITGIQKCDSGEIFFDGKSFENKKNRQENIIGYMSQAFSLFPDLSVEENLKYVMATHNLHDDTKVSNLLQSTFLDKFKTRYAKNLSGGYKQLLSLACAIAPNPKLLILDEPTSAMDPLFREQFWQIIKSNKSKGVSIIVTTHYMEEIKQCDRVMLLKDGQIYNIDNLKTFLSSYDSISMEKILSFFKITDK